MCTHRQWPWVTAVVLIVMAGVGSAAAQLPTYGVGRPPTAEEVQAIYVERCAAYHGETGEDPKYNILVGGRGTLTTDKPIRTIGSFWQYAPTLWSYIRRAQPVNNPGSLTPDQVYAVTAYLLYRNGIIGEQDVMDATTLPRVQMPNRDGFVPDPRPDVGQASK